MKTTTQPDSQSGHTATSSSLPIRDQMILDMDLAGLTDGTQKTYLLSIRAIQNHYGLRPDLLSESQVWDYVLWMRDDKRVAKGTFSGSMERTAVFLLPDALQRLGSVFSQESAPTSAFSHPQGPVFPRGSPAHFDDSKPRLSSLLPLDVRFGVTHQRGQRTDGEEYRQGTAGPSCHRKEE